MIDFQSETSPYYSLYEYFALEQWAHAVQFIDEYVNSKGNDQTVPAHELRFFLHLIILIKIVGLYNAPSQIANKLIEQYTAMLVQMRLNPIVPFYLFHLSEELTTERMLDFLQGLNGMGIVGNPHLESVKKLSRLKIILIFSLIIP